jgi:CubicO group peptidase (beta-lactamase class C family)
MSRQLSWLSFLLLILTISVACSAQETGNVYRALDQVVLNELKETNTPGAAVAIVKQDRIVYRKGFGISDVESGSPVTPEMLFRIGSITKMLTATVLVSLSEEGKIDLDKPIGDFVKGLDQRLSQVTAHQLLSHSAGLIDYAHTCCAQEDTALAEQIRNSKDADIFFTEPGKLFSYSNPGYHIAGYIVQELIRKPYADAMKEKLFEPLGMKHTTHRPTLAMTFPMSQGHTASAMDKPSVVRPFVNNVGDWPSGYVCTNVSDLARFAIAFMNGGRIDGKQVISPGVIATLSKPYIDVPFSWNLPPGLFEGARYGHGFFIQEYRGEHILHHGGTIDGFGSYIVIAPQQRFAVIIFANRTGSILSKSLQKAMELSLPLKPNEQRLPKQSIAMTLPEMQSYAGIYRNGLLQIELFVKNGKLFRKEFYPDTVESGPGHTFVSGVKKVARNRFEFTPPGENTPAQFVVIPGADGRPEYLHSFMEAAKRIDAKH